MKSLVKQSLSKEFCNLIIQYNVALKIKYNKKSGNDLTNNEMLFNILLNKALLNENTRKTFLFINC